ncbi:Cell division protein ZapA, partial [Dysosmobacter welbionis]
PAFLMWPPAWCNSSRMASSLTASCPMLFSAWAKPRPIRERTEGIRRAWAAWHRAERPFSRKVCTICFADEMRFSFAVETITLVWRTLPSTVSTSWEHRARIPLSWSLPTSRRIS